MEIETYMVRSSFFSQMFFRIGTLKNFANFIGNHLCWSLILTKLQALRPATLLNRDSNTGAFLWNSQNGKLVSAIFYKIFISYQMIALRKLRKLFLFHLKSSFCSPDIQIFVFPSSPLFPLSGICFRSWSKVNLKVYDVINCLNKNLITHFVWYPEKGKRYDTETLCIDWVLNKEHFYGKKGWKKLSLFFLLNPVPLNWHSCQNKKGLELETSRSSGCKTSTKNAFVSIYYLN